MIKEAKMIRVTNVKGFEVQSYDSGSCHILKNGKLIACVFGDMGKVESAEIKAELRINELLNK